MEDSQSIQRFKVNSSGPALKDRYLKIKSNRGTNFTPEIKEKLHRILKFEVANIKFVNQNI